MFSHLQSPEENPFGPSSENCATGVAAVGQKAERRAQWGAVLRGATLYTAMAVKARDWAKVRQGEELMTTAGGRAGLDSSLLTAIFGGEVPAIDLSNRLLTACYEAGQTASDQAIAEARAVVRENKASRETAAKSRQAAAWAAEKAVLAQKKAAEKAAFEAAAPLRKAAAATKAAEKAALEQAAAAKAAVSRAAIAGEKAQAVIAQYQGTVGITEDVVAAANEATAFLDGLGVNVTKLSSAPSAWATLKILVGEKSVTVLVDEIRQEPESLRRARRVQALIAEGGIEVDGVILCDDGSEIDVKTL